MKIVDLVGGILDTMTFFPLAIIVLLTMLQDRRRPLWPVAVRTRGLSPCDESLLYRLAIAHTGTVPL